MAATQPIVLELSTVHDLVQHVLRNHAPPSTLVICSSKQAFLHELQQPTAVAEGSEVQVSLAHLFQTPTLRLLSTSRTLRLAFCPDITHLRAYLATYNVSIGKRSQEPDTALRIKGVRPILAILNPVQLHRNTSAFSAQGLNRTFSVAVEAANCTDSELILAETATAQPGDEVEQRGAVGQPQPWDEEVSILNVTTKRLGELSVGRTVKARTIAGRWCTFKTPPESGHT